MKTRPTRYGWSGRLVDVVYYGKTPDTFEDAVTMLLSAYGLRAPPHLDCVSGRCFAFNYSAGEKDFLSCALITEAIVSNLTEHLGIAFQAVSARAHVFGSGTPFIIYGDLFFSAQFHLDTHYYNSNGRYTFCAIDDNGKLLIHDPAGFPAMFCHVDEIDWDGHEAIILTKSEPMRLREIDYMSVMHNGIEIRKRYTWSVEHNHRISRTGFEYAIRYYTCQMSKVVKLAASLSLIDSTRWDNVYALFAGALCLQTGDINGLEKIDKTLWKILGGLC